MKSTLLLYASLASFYVLAAPESKAEPEALPEPQLPFLPLLLGLPLIIGTLGSIAAKEGRNGGGGKCECPSTQRCSASKCECSNQSAINCWVQRRGKCSVQITQCPANGNAGGGLPTSANSEYPPCAGGLPGCPGTKYCKKLDNKCTDFQNLGKCIGICVPNFDAPKPWPKLPGSSSTRPPPAQAPQPLQPQLAPSGPGLCPPAFQCPGPTVCVVDPRSGGQSFMCVAPVDICGGWRSDGCPPGKACVRDPRTNCLGQGCTGLCA